MFKKESIPFAPALIESMRSLGYSFESAIADLIDNSISANAKNINLYMEPSDNPYLIVFDDGNGMNENEIEEAMRYGSKNPLEKRDENDLGRFGLGLKSASLSQCRKLVVASKKNGVISAYSWDLDYVIKTGSWMVIGYDKKELRKFPMIDLLDSVDSGTYILLQNFDRIEESTKNLQKTLTQYMDNTINHLALVFHRYLEDGVEMYVNNEKIEARDPFLRDHKRTQLKRTQMFKINESEILVKPYILPHVNYLTNKDLKKVGGKDQLKNEQGFYVYRNKRLIIWGTWFRLERKDELSKLARVMVDIPNSLDYMWSIDIKKSSANLPDIIKQNLYNCAYTSVCASENVYSYRGRKEQKNKEINYIWERIKLRDGYEYKINREMPQIKMLKQLLSKEEEGKLESFINDLEKNFPTNTLYIDVCKGDISNTKNETINESEDLYNQVKEQVEFARENNLDYIMILDTFMKTEPYCNDNDLIQKLSEMKTFYEEECFNA